MSISEFSMAESVFWEEPYTMPGPCRTCCLRCPCPSIITTIVFVIGLVVFSTGAILAGEETVVLFISSNAFGVFNNWNGYIKWAIYVQLVVMVLLGIILLAMGFLGTGSTRKERMCKFKNRATGRCQTGVFMIVAFFMFILWLAECFLTLAPLMFFVVQNRGICKVYHPSDELLAHNERPNIIVNEDTVCLDLRQWGLVDASTVDPDNFVCGSAVREICYESWVLWYWCACFGGALLTLFAVLFYLINLTANFAKLRKGFKKGRVDRKTGTYVVTGSRAGSRAGSLRGSRRSLRGSRNSLLRGSKNSVRGSRNNILNNANANGATTVNSYSVSGNHVRDGQQSEVSTLRMNAAFEAQPPLAGSGDNLMRDDYYLTPNFGAMNTGYNDNNGGFTDHNGGFTDHNGSQSSWGNTNVTNGSTFTNLKAELETQLEKETPYAMSNGTHQLHSQNSHAGSSISNSHTQYSQPILPPSAGLRPPATHSTFSDPDPPSIQSLDSTYKERHEYFI
ncbi:uncharacterized protein [Amphiura filiformis]|uniref:uncharacterized protein n=1 Tax=Amphiura filiformis TaxID=82378 RepID=UPI003B217081